MSLESDALSLIKSIGWESLRSQKRWLLLQRGDEAEGLIGLLDGLQDFAADKLGVPECEVFDLEEVSSGNLPGKC